MNEPIEDDPRIVGRDRPIGEHDPLTVGSDRRTLESERQIGESRTEVTDTGAALVKRISWPAILAGTLVALGIELMLVAFGFFVGLRMVDPAQANPFGGVARWSLAWYLVTSFIALFVGAWVAARLSGNPARGSGLTHGIVTWGLATVTGFAFLSAVFGNLIGTSVNLLRSAALASTAALQNQGEASRLGEELGGALQNPQVGQLAGNVADQLSLLFLLLWIGLLVAAAASLLGGWLGRPKAIAPRL